MSLYILCGIESHGKTLCRGKTRSDFCFLKEKALVFGSCTKTRPQREQERKPIIVCMVLRVKDDGG